MGITIPSSAQPTATAQTFSLISSTAPAHRHSQSSVCGSAVRSSSPGSFSLSSLSSSSCSSSSSSSSSSGNNSSSSPSSSSSSPLSGCSSSALSIENHLLIAGANPTAGTVTPIAAVTSASVKFMSATNSAALNRVRKRGSGKNTASSIGDGSSLALSEGICATMETQNHVKTVSTSSKCDTHFATDSNDIPPLIKLRGLSWLKLLEYPENSASTSIGNTLVDPDNKMSRYHTHMKYSTKLQQNRHKKCGAGNVMRLKSDDMNLYGLCPETDRFTAVVCNLCDAVVKPQGLKQHIFTRHSSSYLDVTSTISSKQATHNYENSTRLSATAYGNSSGTLSERSRPQLTGSVPSSVLLSSFPAHSSSSCVNKSWPSSPGTSEPLLNQNCSITLITSPFPSLSSSLSSATLPIGILSNASHTVTDSKPVAIKQSVPLILVARKPPTAKLRSKSGSSSSSSSSSPAQIASDNKHELNGMIDIVGDKFSSKNTNLDPDDNYAFESLPLAMRRLSGRGKYHTGNSTESGGHSRKRDANGVQQPISSHNNQSQATVPSIRVADYDPRLNCGVITGDPPLPCMKSLLCKIHSNSMRRLVCGRPKSYDLLLTEFKNTRDKRHNSAGRSLLVPRKPMPSTTGNATVDVIAKEISAKKVVAASKALPVLQTTAAHLAAFAAQNLLPTIKLHRCDTNMRHTNNTRRPSLMGPGAHILIAKSAPLPPPSSLSSSAAVATKTQQMPAASDSTKLASLDQITLEQSQHSAISVCPLPIVDESFSETLLAEHSPHTTPMLLSNADSTEDLGSLTGTELTTLELPMSLIQQIIGPTFDLCDDDDSVGVDYSSVESGSQLFLSNKRQRSSVENTSSHTDDNGGGKKRLVSDDSSLLSTLASQELRLDAASTQTCIDLQLFVAEAMEYQVPPPTLAPPLDAAAFNFETVTTLHTSRTDPLHHAKVCLSSSKGAVLLSTTTELPSLSSSMSPSSSASSARNLSSTIENSFFSECNDALTAAADTLDLDYFENLSCDNPSDAQTLNVGPWLATNVTTANTASSSSLANTDWYQATPKPLTINFGALRRCAGGAILRPRLRAHRRDLLESLDKTGPNDCGSNTHQMLATNSGLGSGSGSLGVNLNTNQPNVKSIGSHAANAAHDRKISNIQSLSSSMGGGGGLNRLTTLPKNRSIVQLKNTHATSLDVVNNRKTAQQNSREFLRNMEILMQSDTIEMRIRQISTSTVLFNQRYAQSLKKRQQQHQFQNLINLKHGHSNNKTITLTPSSPPHCIAKDLNGYDRCLPSQIAGSTFVTAQKQ